MAILFDGSWKGTHGIGRFSSELRRRLPIDRVIERSHPTSPVAPLFFGYQVWLTGKTTGRDVLFSPGYMPAMENRYSQIITIYDTMYLQDHVSGDILRSKYWYHVIRPLIRQFVTDIVTISEHSAECIREFLAEDQVPIHIVGVGVSECFIQRGHANPKADGYLLYVGSDRPHKNVESLIAAFARSQARAEGVKLALTGGMSKMRKRAFDEGGVEAEEVLLLGRPSDQVLSDWYRDALALLIPSHEEGFGLPALEAMASGCPVIYGDCKALREVAGGCGYGVEPTSVEDIRMGIDVVASDVSMRDRMVEKGLEASNAYRWSGVANRVMEVVERREREKRAGAPE